MQRDEVAFALFGDRQVFERLFVRRIQACFKYLCDSRSGRTDGGGTGRDCRGFSRCRFGRSCGSGLFGFLALIRCGRNDRRLFLCLGRFTLDRSRRRRLFSFFVLASCGRCSRRFFLHLRCLTLGSGRRRGLFGFFALVSFGRSGDGFLFPLDCLALGRSHRRGLFGFLALVSRDGNDRRFFFRLGRFRFDRRCRRWFFVLLVLISGRNRGRFLLRFARLARREHHQLAGDNCLGIERLRLVISPRLFQRHFVYKSGDRCFLGKLTCLTAALTCQKLVRSVLAVADDDRLTDADRLDTADKTAQVLWCVGAVIHDAGEIAYLRERDLLGRRGCVAGGCGFAGFSCHFNTSMFFDLC